jgi:hypothetical protein
MSRQTLFGLPAPQILDPKRKAKLVDLARRAVHSTALPPNVDRLTGNHVLVYEALLWRFHRNTRAVCFPALQTIADWVGCAVDTVCEALRRLERLGLITWTHRIRRVLAPSLDPANSSPTRSRVLRTSNAYRFTMPSAPIRRTFQPKPSFEGKQRGPRNPHIEPSLVGQQQIKNDFRPIGNWVLDRVEEALRRRKDSPS